MTEFHSLELTVAGSRDRKDEYIKQQAAIKNRLVALNPSMFLGLLDADRFHLGKYKTAISKAVTLGGLGLWWFLMRPYFCLMPSCTRGEKILVSSEIPGVEIQNMDSHCFAIRIGRLSEIGTESDTIIFTPILQQQQDHIRRRVFLHRVYCGQF